MLATLTFDGTIQNGATVQDVEAAIQALDGVDTTLLIVEILSGKSLTIGGGPERFVAEIAEDSHHRWTVVEPDNGDESIELVVGGQLVDYPARVCVTVKAALEAARTFMEQDGARSPRVVWSVET